MLSSSGGTVRLYFLVTLSQSYFVHTQPLVFRRWWNHWMAQVSKHTPYHYGRYDFTHTRKYICSWITVVSTYPFLTLWICINNMHSVLIILWSLNFDLSLASWHMTALSLGVWQQQQAAALGQSLKHMNKQPIYHRSFHCWAVAFCGPGILAECLT